MEVGDPAEGLDEQSVVLVRVADGRVDDDRWRRRLHEAVRHTIHAGRHGHDPTGIDAEVPDDLFADGVADGHHDIGAAERAGNRPREEALLDHREVLRMVERLQVVDGDHHWPGRTHRDAPTDMVHGVEASGPWGKPGRLACDPPDPVAAVTRGGNHLELVAEVWMRL